MYGAYFSSLWLTIIIINVWAFHETWLKLSDQNYDPMLAPNSSCLRGTSRREDLGKKCPMQGGGGINGVDSHSAILTSMLLIHLL